MVKAKIFIPKWHNLQLECNVRFNGINRIIDYFKINRFNQLKETDQITI